MRGLTLMPHHMLVTSAPRGKPLFFLFKRTKSLASYLFSPIVEFLERYLKIMKKSADVTGTEIFNPLIA
jgi:hypothetical protein